MKTSAPRAPLLAALLGAALAACGGDGAANAAGEGTPAASGPVYTSEVENVSRWIREGGADADSAGLTAKKNPRGEGVLVYAGGADTAAGGERAAWVVVDSQVVPLNEASRRATPTLPARDDERTWERIGIRRDGGNADPRGVGPDDPPPASRPPAPPRPDTGAGTPTPLPPAAAPADTLRVPADTPTSPRAGESRDTLLVPATPPGGAPARDTVRAPLPKPAEPSPAPLPDTLVVSEPAAPEVLPEITTSEASLR